MLKIKDEGIILEKTQLKFENKAVLNPACILVDGITHMFYRAINQKDISSIGYCQLKNNKVIKRLKTPILYPEFDYERGGVEDPRITFLDGTYYLFYTAFDGKNALIAYATSQDLTRFTKKGLVSPKISYDEAEDIFRESGVNKKYTQFEKYYKKYGGWKILLWEKDASLFPRKINGKYVLIHRILPGIQLISFDKFSKLRDLSFWKRYLKNLDKYIILDPKSDFESRNIGGGCPPIETKDGWLLIYHAIQNKPTGNIYRASAALLDFNDPTKVIGRLNRPLFSPQKGWEKKGIVDNVVFPTGAIVKDGRLMIYYGAADNRISAKSIDIRSLIMELTRGK